MSAPALSLRLSQTCRVISKGWSYLPRTDLGAEPQTGMADDESGAGDERRRLHETGRRGEQRRGHRPREPPPIIRRPASRSPSVSITRPRSGDGGDDQHPERRLRRRPAPGAETEETTITRSGDSRRRYSLRSAELNPPTRSRHCTGTQRDGNYRRNHDKHQRTLLHQGVVFVPSGAHLLPTSASSRPRYVCRSDAGDCVPRRQSPGPAPGPGAKEERAHVSH